MENYYQVLKVAPSTSQYEIRKAYIALVKKCHPDLVGEGNGAASADRMNLLNEAYHTLKNPQRRAEYDRMLRILEKAAEPTTKIKKEGKVTEMLMDAAVNKLMEKVMALDERIKWKVKSTGRFDRLISGRKGRKVYHVFIRVIADMAIKRLIPDFKKICEEKKVRFIRTFCLFLLLADSVSDIEKKVVSDYNLINDNSRIALIDIDSGKIFFPHSEDIKPPVSKISL